MIGGSPPDAGAIGSVFDGVRAIAGEIGGSVGVARGTGVGWQGPCVGCSAGAEGYVDHRVAQALRICGKYAAA